MIASWAGARGGLAVLALWACGFTDAARARDLWLEPEPLAAPFGEEVSIHLRWGERFHAEEERSLAKARLARFDVSADGIGRRDLLAEGQEGELPAAKVKMQKGSSLVVLSSMPQQVIVEGERFERELADDGLDGISAARERLGQSDQPGNELYSRFLKALVEPRDPASGAPNTVYKRRVGQRLEILLENDPSRLNRGGPLAVKVLFDDRPLAGRKVFAYRRTGANAAEEQTAVTSVAGRAVFKVSGPGAWLVRLAYMRPASRGAAAEVKPVAEPAQWESFYSTYTFAVHEAPSALPKPPAPTPARSATPAD